MYNVLLDLYKQQYPRLVYNNLLMLSNQHYKRKIVRTITQQFYIHKTFPICHSGIKLLKTRPTALKTNHQLIM